MIFAILIFLFLSIIYSFAPLLKERQWGELSVTLLIFLLGSFYALEAHFDIYLLPDLSNILNHFVPWAQSLAEFSQQK